MANHNHRDDESIKESRQPAFLRIGSRIHANKKKNRVSTFSKKRHERNLLGPDRTIRKRNLRLSGGTAPHIIVVIVVCCAASYLFCGSKKFVVDFPCRTEGMNGPWPATPFCVPVGEEEEERMLSCLSRVEGNVNCMVVFVVDVMVGTDAPDTDRIKDKLIRKRNTRPKMKEEQEQEESTTDEAE